MKKIVSVIAVTLALVGFLAVKSTPTFADAANGKKLYTDAEKNKCASCHGDEGKGDGKKGKKLDPKPTNFTDAATWAKKDKAPALEPEARMKKAITEGGPSVGQGKGMEAYKDFTPAEVNDLIDYIKTLKK